MGSRWQTQRTTHSEPGIRTMAFVNEFVSAEDARKYGLEEIDRRHFQAHFRPEWTIDRERDIYLRQVESGREEHANRCGFTFYWKGVLLLIRLTRRGAGTPGGDAWTEWSLLDSPVVASITGLPAEELQKNRPEILADLKAALTAYKDFGARSSSARHTATFTF
jgi:hypothetical protein